MVVFSLVLTVGFVIPAASGRSNWKWGQRTIFLGLFASILVFTVALLDSAPVGVAADRPDCNDPSVRAKFPILCGEQKSLSGGASGPVIFVFILIALAFYFMPTLTAMGREKINTGAIFALNLFLGWTLVGWVVALVWALAHDQMIFQKSEQQSPTSALHCPHCHREIQKDWKICPFCQYTLAERQSGAQ